MGNKRVNSPLRRGGNRGVITLFANHHKSGCQKKYFPCKSLYDPDPYSGVGCTDIERRADRHRPIPNRETEPQPTTGAISAACDQPVTLSFSTADGTATTSDSDYIAKTGTLTFAPGETTKTITIEVRGDSKKEPTRRSTWTCSATAAIRCSPRIAASVRS